MAIFNSYVTNYQRVFVIDLYFVCGTSSRLQHLLAVDPKEKSTIGFFQREKQM
jgi:hypothetical protein